MNKKSKGTAAERELIHLFWGAGWAAFRAAGSGSIKYPCPDIIAGNNIKKFAIEVKTTADTTKYFSQDEVDELAQFAARFGAEAWLAVKFAKQPWFFFSPDNLEKTPKGYSISVSLAQRRGLLFEEVARP